MGSELYPKRAELFLMLAEPEGARVAGRAGEMRGGEVRGVEPRPARQAAMKAFTDDKQDQRYHCPEPASPKQYSSLERLSVPNKAAGEG